MWKPSRLQREHKSLWVREGPSTVFGRRARFRLVAHGGCREGRNFSPGEPDQREICLGCGSSWAISVGSAAPRVDSFRFHVSSANRVAKLPAYFPFVQSWGICTYAPGHWSCASPWVGPCLSGYTTRLPPPRPLTGSPPYHPSRRILELSDLGPRA